MDEMHVQEGTKALHPFRMLPPTAWIVPAALMLFVFGLAFQGSRGLWERDEGRYTDIALRMLETRDFVVPAFNDDVPHFAKPPLTYWAVAGGIALLGWNEWGARLANALAFIATVMIVHALARRITPGRAWLPPLIYASFLFPFAAANVVTTDTLLALWEAVAVLGFVEWRHSRERSRQRLFLLIMWGGFGLAFLTKGPPGLLPLIAIAAFVAAADGWKAPFRLLFSAGIAVFLAVGFGWYLLVAFTHPGLMTYFIRDEFVNRIATGMHHRNPQWFKPLAIYLPVLVIGTMPWTVSLLNAIRSARNTLFSRRWWRDKLATDQWPPFLILWVTLPLAVFFASSSRLPLYILPLFVPLALAAGRLTSFPAPGKAAVYLLAAWMIMLPALKCAASFYPYEKDSRRMAYAIRNAVHPSPREIVFIDSEPFWGLNLYLHGEVERISTNRTTRSEEPLSEELLEREPDVLYVVDKRHEARTREYCEKLGFAVNAAGEHGTWIFLKPSKIRRDGSPSAMDRKDDGI